MKTRWLLLMPLLFLQALFPIEASAQQPEADRKNVEAIRSKADQGDTAAQCELGLRYCSGDGVAKDYVEALKWLRKAADQGDAKAEYNIGVCYERGEGVPKDPSVLLLETTLTDSITLA